VTDTEKQKRAVKRRKEHRMTPVSHGMLFGADSIAAFFRVSRRTVISWKEDGAPISCGARGRYDADSSALFAWRVANSK
jgi:hypothetical protein